jgi:hypothetical protein
MDDYVITSWQRCKLNIFPSLSSTTITAVQQLSRPRRAENKKRTRSSGSIRKKYKCVDENQSALLEGYYSDEDSSKFSRKEERWLGGSLSS